MNMTRTQLRAHFKQRRSQLSGDDRASANAAICGHLADFVQTILAQTATVGAYMGTSDEVDLRVWIASYIDHGGQVALPRIAGAGAMDFLQHDPAIALQTNVLDIAEPALTNPHVKAVGLDLLLVPLVAFDSHGTRLGMGGGFYDRYLPLLRADARVLGVAYACQQSTKELPREEWDVPLSTVVTEHGILDLS